MKQYNIMTQTVQKPYNKNIFGFDIETYGKNNKFYCASLYHLNNDLNITFFNSDELINHFKSSVFKNSIVCATNLGFDFFGTFINNREELEKFKLLSSGSKLLSAKSYIKNKEFSYKRTQKASILFLDTLNYAQLSVEKLGKIIGIPKLTSPASLGRRPHTQQEKDELIVYNMRDAEISCKGLHFLYKSFYDLGATPKITIASTSMSLFRNKYLEEKIFCHDVPDLLEIFKGYYGGRTEAFGRGIIKNYHYYDYNSLYPYVMYENLFPDPNTLRKDGDKHSLIYKYEGMSNVTIKAPYMKYPLLPLKYDKKLVFPYGKFSGWYTHVELRKAETLGYEIKKIHKTFYYKKSLRPFKNYVIDLYEKRKMFKKHNNPMEYVTKISMNSLYGKFGQKFLDRDNFIPMPPTLDEVFKNKSFKRVGNFLRVTNDSPPACFCIPIWASYITAYARLKLYDGIMKSKPVYVDTDSLITRKEMPTGGELGMLKLEKQVKKGIIVKPKFYATFSKKEWDIKIKGFGRKVEYDDFVKILLGNSAIYKKFTKIRESQRRGMDVNSIQEVEKIFSLEDNKRQWDNKFNSQEFQESEPIEVNV